MIDSTRSSRVFKCLSNPHRLEIYLLIHAHRRLHTGKIAELIGIRPSVASEHLMEMQELGLLIRMSIGTFSDYSINDSFPLTYDPDTGVLAFTLPKKG